MSSLEVKDSCIDLEGRYIRLKRLDPEEDYFELYSNSHGTVEKEAIWNYLHIENLVPPLRFLIVLDSS